MQNIREHPDTNDRIDILTLNTKIAMIFAMKYALPISLRWKRFKILEPLLVETLLQSASFIIPQIFWVVSDSISKYSRYNKIEKNSPMPLSINMIIESRLCQKLLMSPKSDKRTIAIAIVKYLVNNKLR